MQMADASNVKKSVPIGDSTSLGWDAMKNNLGFFIIALLIMWVAMAIPSGLQSMNAYFGNAAVIAIWGIIFGLLALVVGIFVNMAVVKIGLRFVSGETADFPDLYIEYPKFLDFLVGSILYGLLVLAGFILLIVPGIYWAVRYHFYGYLIIDRGMKPVEAIKKSGQITRGAWWSLFVFWLAMIGIYILGWLCCCVGIFAAMPVMFVSIAYVYRTLLAATPEAMKPEEQPNLPPQPEQPAEQ